MSASQIVSAASNHGYHLTQADGKIQYVGKGGLPSNLLEQMREHKQAMIVYLIARDKLAKLSSELNWPADDLLDWYQRDMAEIERKTMVEVHFIIRDYCQNYIACRDLPDHGLLNKSRTIK